MFSFLVLLLFSVCLAEETVKFAAVIYRHGDRTPVDTYPTDPWRNESLWPVKFGELTNCGKSQHYVVGQWLRMRYSHLLSKSFDPTELYVRSTDVDRTLMSAQANLAGMYPPVGKSIWNKHLMWQPIPIHTMPEMQDEVLAMKKKCPAYNKELDRVQHTKAYRERLSRYQGLMNYLSAYTGKVVKDYEDIVNIYSTLYIETLYNFTLPNWTNSVYPDKMREPACYSFTTAASSPLLARLRAGPLLKDIMAKINKVTATCARNKDYLKVSIYSGHDFTIGTVLTALGMFDGDCPVYTATILIELVEDDSGSNYIRIGYRNATDIMEPHILPIPYCGKRCPVEKFKKLYENLLTVDFDHECGKQFPVLLGISFFSGLVVFASIYVAHKIYFEKVSARQRGFHNSYRNTGLVGVKPLKVGHV